MQFHQPAPATDYPNLYPTGRLSLVARSSSDIASSDKYPTTYQHAATQVVVAIAGGKYHFKQDTFATITTETGRNHGFVNRYHHFEVSYDKAADMGINDFTVQYIMLP